MRDLKREILISGAMDRRGFEMKEMIEDLFPQSIVKFSSSSSFTPIRKSQVWGRSEVGQLLHLVKEGFSISEIAIFLERTEVSINKRLLKITHARATKPRINIKDISNIRSNPDTVAIKSIFPINP